MKKLLTPLLVLALAACSSSGSKDSSAQDSTAVTSDSSIVTSVTADAPIEAVAEEAESDTSQLGKLFEDVSTAIHEKEGHYYTVTISISQYEGSSDVTWYFDSTLSPVYFKENWALEGNEGSNEYFITDSKKVVCAHTEGGMVVDTWCNTTGGTRTINDESSGEATSNALPDDYGTQANVFLKRAFEDLIQLLNEADITQKDESDYTLRLEKTVDVGQEVTETAEIHIPRVVYKDIVGE